MTDDRIIDIFEAHGQYVTGKDYAMIRAIAEAVSPQRTWVGLTEDERTTIREGAAKYHDVTGWGYARAVQQATELKLQEKNT